MSGLSVRYAPKTLMRLADIEDALASGKSDGRVMHEMQLRHGLSPRHVRRLMALARARWARESSATGREQRRDQLRTAAWMTYRAAMMRKAMTLDKRNREHYVPNPDAGAAVRALEFVARLDGDLTQPNAGIVVGFGDEALKAIAQIYGSGQAPEIEATVVEMPQLPDGEKDG